ncbi:unnamed protein product [Brachionus calyciflorus]|uniref:HAUS augmin-like complex subunit 4 n=1 Tax=Brachionus calyciflorus TaxID=104777 RepID=A0A813V8R5_9BILA|nr:unnamed protein product [Brachionus calyciflorus]
MNLNDINRKEILKEFNHNYRSYLENQLIVNLLTDILINSQAQLVHSGSSSSFDSQKCDASLQLEDKIRDTFLKSYYIYNNSDKNTEVLDEIKIEPLNFNAKEYLTNKIECKFNKDLGIIDQFLNFKNPSKELSNSKWHLSEDDINFDSEIDEKFPQDLIVSKFNDLVECINKLESDITKINNEMNIKFEHCLNISIEIINLLKRILKDFRLDFYANKNEIECENSILNCDLLLTKIETVQNEMLHDLYSPDKLKALGIVKNHIQMETMVTKEKLEQTQYSLNMFKSFGNEFDSMLKTYLDLKAKHESKQWTLNKLKQDSHF